MNVKTWLDFLKKSKQNNKFSSPHDPAREIRINLAPGNFLGAPTTLPTLLTEKNQLNEDLHDALSDAGLRGIHSVDFSIYGSAVSITIIPEEITVDLNQHKLKTVLMSHLTSKGYIQESRALTEEKGRMRQYGIYRLDVFIYIYIYYVYI